MRTCHSGKTAGVVWSSSALRGSHIPSGVQFPTATTLSPRFVATETWKLTVVEAAWGAFDLTWKVLLKESGLPSAPRENSFRICSRLDGLDSRVFESRSRIGEMDLMLLSLPWLRNVLPPE